MFVLRVLSELGLVLLVQESECNKGDDGTEKHKMRREKLGRTAEGLDDGSPCSQIIPLISTSLLPRLVLNFKY